MDNILSRRAALGLAAGGAAAVALGSARPASAASGASGGPSAASLLSASSALSRPDRVFLARGLMHGAWVRSEGGEWYPDAALWGESGFTTPTFYMDPLYNSDLLDSLPGTTWSLACAPSGTNLSASDLPDPTAEWLSTEQLANEEQLFTCCFGDEEGYSATLTDWFADAYAYMHDNHPNVLVHNNQAVGQYTDAQMATYLSTARPDLVTFDYYYWQKAPYYAGGSITPLYNHTGRYRRLAVNGLDGDGASPIAFGQYTCGFRLQPAESSIDGVEQRYLRRYFVSESQQHIVSFVTWAFGGRWLDLFRWDLTAGDLPWETDGLFLTDEDGNPRPQLLRYADLNQTMRAYSPYLTRLRNRSASIVHGQVGETGAATTASTEIGAFTANTDPGSGLVSVTATNVGTVNSKAPGDVVVGTFRALPDMSAEEAAGVLPDQADTPAFLLVNALAVANDDYYDPDSTGGSGENTRQRLTVTVQPPSGKNLYRVDRQGKGLKRVSLKRVSSGWQFTVSVKGGQGELYLWG